MIQGYWLLPTRGRLDNVRRFFAAAKATGISTPGFLLVDEDELFVGDIRQVNPDYAALDLPEGWQIMPIFSKQRGACGAMREAALRCGSADWIGMLADDLIPETPEWDRILLDEIKGWNFVSSNDGWQAPNRCNGAIVFSKPLLDAWGWLAPPDFWHLYVDDVWETIGRSTGCWQVKMDVMVRHFAAARDKSTDQTYSIVNSPDFYEHDERCYKKWQRDDMGRAVDATLALMRYRDVPLLEDPDLSDLSIQIATPCLDGRYDRNYLKALINTFNLLVKYGAKVDWSEIPFCSDIAMARNKIVSGFRRSPHTHLMMIDSDMGWDPRDVARLASYRRDFAAAAGPKKVFPTSYCYNIWEHGQEPGVVYSEAETGLIEVDQVGGAFIMISKTMIERMVAAYPALAYHGDNGRKDYALFDPMILESGHRVSEDFAFCKRWRRIGGKIHMNPRIVLQHSGNYVWMGAPADVLGANNVDHVSKFVELKIMPPVAEAAE